MAGSQLKAISPIDGRYFQKTQVLGEFFSEFALIYYRLLVEIRWIESLAANPDIPEIQPLDQATKDYLQTLLTQFNEEEALKVKAFEAQTNHDVKAVEYYLQEKFAEFQGLASLISYIHFGCTSEDINNVAYALMVKEALSQVIQPTLVKTTKGIEALALQHADAAMLSHTHGQAATPTTLGKELINFAARLQRPLQQLEALSIPAKFNGAVGNYNAHVIAYPDLNWPEHCQQFISSLGLSFNRYTTQIEPHDGIAELSQLMVRINTILEDYATDIWSYISLGYFKQKTRANQVGSSTMPHKVNPIDFENAEGNLGLANALFNHFALKLPRSRLQRDLSDSTVMRNLGLAFAHAFLAYQSLMLGNDKLEINPSAMEAALADHWEILGEAVQTVMRRYRLPNAYERLRDLSRGQAFNQAQLYAFIETLEIPNEAKARLLALTPANYTGLAADLVKKFTCL